MYAGVNKSAFRLKSSLRCPRCAGRVEIDPAPRCLTADCPYAEEGFPVAEGQPVLIDFETSLFRRGAYACSSGSVFPRDNARVNWRTRIRDFGTGRNPVAGMKCRRLVDMLKARAPEPIVLVIGGGAIGLGADILYSDESIELVGTDVYASPFTQVVADGHQLPFESELFDAVWIQAVLEHVLDPRRVVDEIHRVLKPGGLVYADTPFMQQVHEGAYDFTRFTMSGHRWLFRRFEEIEAGPVGGPAVALSWSLRYMIRALGFGDKFATAAGFSIAWLRVLDRFMHKGLKADAASGLFFLGAKSDRELSPRDMLEYFALSR